MDKRMNGWLKSSLFFLYTLVHTITIIINKGLTQGTA